jgi:hypothetical protein
MSLNNKNPIGGNVVMRQKEDIREDIYNYSRQLDKLIKRIQSATIDDNSKSAILEFYRDYLVQGYSQARKIKYLNTLKTISVQLGQSFENITRQDIAEWLHRLCKSSASLRHF